MKFRNQTVLPLAAAFVGFALAATSANAATIAVSSYIYDTGGVPQGGQTSLVDAGELKLTDGIYPISGWNDGTNVGFKDGTTAQKAVGKPTVTFDLGGLVDLTTVDIWTEEQFRDTESVTISSSDDGVTFSPTVVATTLNWVEQEPYGDQVTIDVSSLPAGQFYKMVFVDSGQWMMLTEVEFRGTSDGGGGNDFRDWIALQSVGGLIAFDDDFDKDGNGNGLENFFGTDPSVFSAGLIAGTLVGGDTFGFTHPQNATPADDITAPAYRWSKNLVTWHADGDPDGEGTTVNFTPSIDDPVEGTTTVTAEVTGTATDDVIANVIPATAPLVARRPPGLRSPGEHQQMRSL